MQTSCRLTVNINYVLTQQGHRILWLYNRKIVYWRDSALWGFRPNLAELCSARQPRRLSLHELRL